LLIWVDAAAKLELLAGAMENKCAALLMMDSTVASQAGSFSDAGTKLLASRRLIFS